MWYKVIGWLHVVIQVDYHVMTNWRGTWNHHYDDRFLMMILSNMMRNIKMHKTTILNTFEEKLGKCHSPGILSEIIQKVEILDWRICKPGLLLSLNIPTSREVIICWKAKITMIRIIVFSLWWQIGRCHQTWLQGGRSFAEVRRVFVEKYELGRKS